MLEQVKVRLVELMKQKTKVGNSRRKTQWKESVQHDLQSNYGKMVYRHIRHNYIPSIQVVRLDKDQEGRRFTADPEEVMDVFMNKWRNVYFRHEEVNREELARQFLEKYEDYIPAASLQMEELKGIQLKEALMDMGEGAGGLDGWTIKELCRLPIFFLGAES